MRNEETTAHISSIDMKDVWIFEKDDWISLWQKTIGSRFFGHVKS